MSANGYETEEERIEARAARLEAAERLVYRNALKKRIEDPILRWHYLGVTLPSGWPLRRSLAALSTNELERIVTELVEPYEARQAQLVKAARARALARGHRETGGAMMPCLGFYEGTGQTRRGARS